MPRTAMKIRIVTAGLSTALCFVCSVQAIGGQSNAFTYQGKLTDRGSPATNHYDFLFKLFDVPSGGTQIGRDLVRADVAVTNGIFTVDLDFGTSAFGAGTEHYVEIAVRPEASTGAYTALRLRELIADSPYAVQTIRATSVIVADDALPPAESNASRFQASWTRPPTLRNATYVIGSRASPPARRVRETPRPNFGPSPLVDAGEQRSSGYKLHVVSQYNLGLRVQTDEIGGQVASFGGYGDFQIDAPGIAGGRMALKESGRLGVGTNDPLAMFDLRGGADSDGSNDLQAMAFQWRAGGYRHWIRTRHNGTVGGGNAIDFFVNNSPTSDGSSAPGAGSLHVMTLDSGRVGIGTTAPAEKLTVAGTIHSTTGGFRFPDGSVQMTAGDSNATYHTIVREDDVALVGWFGSNTTVLQLNIPAGTYLVTATLRFRNENNFSFADNTRFFECKFSNEPGSGDVSYHYSTQILGASSLLASFHSIVTVSAGGVTLLCHAFSDQPTQIYAAQRRMTATRILGTVDVQ